MRLFSSFTILCLLLTGCSLITTSTQKPNIGLAIGGRAMGGQQPIAGAHVYLFAANTTGYAGAGISASSDNASVSLLQSADTGLSDSIGAYVLSDSNGNFSISGDYICTPNTQVYMYALGGNPGLSPGTNNAAAGLLAVLGNCPIAENFQSATPFVFMNEVSTIAAAYAMAGFATDATHVSSSGTPLAQVDIQNAFANAANLASLSTGSALATTPAGNGTVPQSTIKTLANVLASCINSSDPSTAPGVTSTCNTLFTNASSTGSTGVAPSDTATAAINIAHNPGSNTAALFGLQSATSPFPQALSQAPTDFLIGIQFTGSGLNGPNYAAIDALGNAWITNYEGASVTELSSTGDILSGANGITGGGLGQPEAVAIDQSGNAWVANYSGSRITEISGTGSILSGTNGYGSSDLYQPSAIAIDGSGNVWAASYSSTGNVIGFSPSGDPIPTAIGYSGFSYPDAIAIDGSKSLWLTEIGQNTLIHIPSAGVLSPSINEYTAGGFDRPDGVAVDGQGNIWVANANAQGVIKLSNGGTELSPSGGYTGGGIIEPDAVAIDGAGNVWVANGYPHGLSELSSSGVVISPSAGYEGGGVLPASPVVAVDGSGDVWATYLHYVAEFIGAATPVITPIAAGLPATPTANGTSSLGSRP